MHCSSDLSQCWVLASRCFVWDFFWLQEGEQPTRNWRLTLHLSYRFWIWWWLNNLELILPRRIFPQALFTAHTPLLSLLRCSHWKHTFSAAILWCSNLSCLWSVHACLLNIQVMKLSCQTQTLHLLFWHKDTHSHSGFYRAPVIPLTERHALPTHGASLLTRSCHSVNRHQYFYTINDLDQEQYYFMKEEGTAWL